MGCRLHESAPSCKRKIAYPHAPSFRTARTLRADPEIPRLSKETYAARDSGSPLSRRPGMTLYFSPSDAAMISCKVATWRAKAARPAAVAVTVVCGFLPTKALSIPT